MLEKLRQEDQGIKFSLGTSEALPEEERGGKREGRGGEKRGRGESRREESRREEKGQQKGKEEQIGTTN